MLNYQHIGMFPCDSQAIVNSWDLIFDPSCCEAKCILAYFKHILKVSMEKGTMTQLQSNPLQ